jgi:hypothetical protein
MFLISDSATSSGGRCSAPSQGPVLGQNPFITTVPIPQSSPLTPSLRPSIHYQLVPLMLPTKHVKEMKAHDFGMKFCSETAHSPSE